MAFFDKVSGFTKNVGEKVSDFAKNVGDTTNNMIEIGRIKSKINAEQENITALKAQLGELYWNKYAQGEDLSSDGAEICASIQSALDNINAMQDEIQAIKEREQEQQEASPAPEARPCPNCGALVAAESRFCSNCGKYVPIEEAAAEAEPPKKAFCTNCGAPCEPDAKFCSSCGKALT